KVPGHDDVGGLVVGNGVVEYLDAVVGVDDDARTGRHAGHRRTLGAEIRVVVLVHVVLEHTRGVSVHGQVGHVEHQDAAGVVGRGVAVDIGVGRVFDLAAGDVAGHRVVAHDGVFRLADIDARVRRVLGHAILDQQVFGADRVQAVG